MSTILQAAIPVAKAALVFIKAILSFLYFVTASKTTYAH